MQICYLVLIKSLDIIFFIELGRNSVKTNIYSFASIRYDITLFTLSQVTRSSDQSELCG